MLPYAVALALFPADALAWGLGTHLFFAHWVLAALPFSDAELRAAAARLPVFVLAGACLPDLALAGRALGAVAFRRSHQWSTLRRMAAAPRSEADRALAIGYASHLLSDVVAHNEFVPEHEARIARLRHVTHAIAEFAMDEHLRGSLPLNAAAALEAEHATVVGFVARAFRCDEALAARALSLLAGGDRALRASPVPRLCRRSVAWFYRDPAYRFDGYVARVKRTLGRLEQALAGGFTDWVDSDPEGRPCDGAADERARSHIARVMQAENHARDGDERGEAGEQAGERRVVARRDHGKGDRVKGVP
jgi:hypothetical protein